MERAWRQFLDQQSNQHFAVEPSPGALGIIFGKMAQLCNLFEALEDQFDLPAQAIPFQTCPALSSLSATVVKTKMYPA